MCELFSEQKFPCPVLPRSRRLAFGLVLIGMLAGCGGSGSEPRKAGTAVAPASPAGMPTTTVASAPTANPAPESAATPNGTEGAGKETKWIGKIPYDVFYDQPLSIATDTTSVVSLSPGENPSPASVSTPSASPAMPAKPGGESAGGTGTPAAGGGAVNWGDILPMPLLVEEVKLLRTDLTGNLQTVATFNKSQKPTALDGAILAAMAMVAENHPENVSWKPNAHFIRDLAFQINENSAGTGRGPYTKTKDPFDKLLVILDGGKPPEMESPETKPYSEVVYVADMMKRIEQSFNNLKTNVNTGDRLKENAAMAERETRILLTLATLMTDKSYDNADQPKYQGFLKRFTEGARSGVQAIHTGSLEGFQAALNQIQTTCAECHQEYKGSESGF